MSKLNAAIVGIGQTEFSKNSGRSELQLACECIKQALDDAGVSPSDVDGMSTFTLDNSEDIDLVRSLGIENLRFSSRVPHGGGGACGVVSHAAAVVTAGLADMVVVWRAMNERSGQRFGQAQLVPGRQGSGSDFITWSMPFGALSPANWMAMNLQRYMDVYEVSNADLGHVSVAMRKHAATNPAAWFYQKPITLDEHQASRWIIEPTLRLLDCCQESDGGVAMVITNSDIARDLKQAPVQIKAATQVVPFGVEVVTNYYHGELSIFKEARFLGKELYRQSGLTPEDFQVAMLYDHFTPIVLMQLEALGFCDYGQGKYFVKEGNIALDGRIPVNPNGGLIGEAYIHGVNNIIEGVRQLRGSAVNQVKNVEHVLVSSGMSGLVLNLS
ncbi:MULTISPECIES: lipid-transfer protein [unclassified Microbulbifer]|uniref:Lipid-transfer protein n=1 Tax=Microbulbifer spongiae TaxID=2944933 RepID=A0ABY9EAB7_9GAMM|nr:MULTISPECIES: lipid-transfer protein [unclassified Microbulbifer]MDP5209534.1 lipid-transfer protein [Microbulbifer sp. 2205BS26-8]WKD49038.1 lipid-transfer protein [Microbulbifer sp. MI-G]